MIISPIKGKMGAAKNSGFCFVFFFCFALFCLFCWFVYVCLFVWFLFSILHWLFTSRHSDSWFYKKEKKSTVSLFFFKMRIRIRITSCTKEKPYMINSQVLHNWKDKKSPLGYATYVYVCKIMCWKIFCVFSPVTKNVKIGQK